MVYAPSAQTGQSKVNLPKSVEWRTMVNGLCSKRANRPKYSKFTRTSGVEDHGPWSMLQARKQAKVK